MSFCAHPKERRSLLHGYDVVCDACCRTIGRVALFPCVVLDQAEAAAVLSHLPDEGPSVLRSARASLEARS